MAESETRLAPGVRPLGQGDINSGWQKTYRGRLIFRDDIVIENAKEALVYDKIVNAPSYPKLLAAYKRFQRSLHSANDPYMLSEVQEAEQQPWRLLTAHGSVMNAKSGAAKTLRSLADAVFSETKLPRAPEGKFRGENGLKWDAVKVKSPKVPSVPVTPVGREFWQEPSLQSVQSSRSPLSQSSDERQEHSLVVESDDPRVEKWLKDQGRMDVRGVDTPNKKARKVKPKRKTGDTTSVRSIRG